LQRSKITPISKVGFKNTIGENALCMAFLANTIKIWNITVKDFFQPLKTSSRLNFYNSARNKIIGTEGLYKLDKVIRQSHFKQHTYGTVSNNILSNNLSSNNISTNDVSCNNISSNDVLSNNVLSYDILSNNILSNDVLSNNVLSNDILSNDVLSKTLSTSFGLIKCH
jgi:hypothetical protein